MVRSSLGSATVSGGTGSKVVSVPGSMGAGVYDLYGVYSENEGYQGGEGRSTLTVLVPTVTSVADVLASRGELAEFMCTVTHHDGQNVTGGTVQFRLGSTNIGSPVTVVDGVARLEYTVPSSAVSGTSISATFIRNGLFEGSSDDTGVLMVRGSINVSVPNVSVNRGTASNVQVLVTDVDDDDVASGEVKVYIDNTQYGSTVNVVDGVASLSLNLDSSISYGTHTLRVVYQENDDYDECTGTGTLVVRTPVTISVDNVSANPGGNVTFSATVRDINNVLVTEGTLVFRYDTTQYVGQSSVNANGTGSVSLTLPANISNTHTIQVNFPQTDNYLLAQGDGVLTIRKGVVITVESAETTQGSQITLNATVKDTDNNNVNTGTLTFEIEPQS